MAGKKDAIGVFSALGTFGLLALIAWRSCVVGIVVRELIVFISGGFRVVASNHTTFLMMFPTIIAVVVLELPCVAGLSILQAKIFRRRDSKRTLSDLFKIMGGDNHFFSFFMIVLLEELFARWLFLGLLTKISFLSGAVAFYALFLIGNSAWALMHLSNLKEEKDRKVFYVLPQFSAGVFFTYVFVKYGLLAVILAHFASNAVVFAFHKVQRINVVDGLIIGYGALCVASSYALMKKPLADVLPWFANNPVFSLKGWGFWDYVIVSVFLSSCFTVTFSLLLYDRGEAGRKSFGKDAGPIGYIFAIPTAIGALYGIYALLGLFIVSVPYRVLVVAIVFTFLQKGRSGSAVARSFWTGLPDTYVTMCIVQALGFWLALGWVAVNTAIYVPRLILNKFDD